MATTIDRNKARMYYRKALDAEPERIGWATLRTRGFFATDAKTDEQRFASYMDYYQWLLSIDEKKLKENWLPTRPPRQTVPTQPEDEMRRTRRERFEQFKAQSPPRPSVSGGGFLDDIKGQAEVTAYNLVHEAAGRMAIDHQARMWSEGRAIQHLRMLAERFPGTSAAKRAQAELERIAKGLVDGVLSMPPDDLGMGEPMASLPVVSHVDGNELKARAATGDGSGPAGTQTTSQGPYCCRRKGKRLVAPVLSHGVSDSSLLRRYLCAS